MHKYKVGFVYQAIYMDEVVSSSACNAAREWLYNRKRGELVSSECFRVYVRDEKNRLYTVIVEAIVTFDCQWREMHEVLER